MSLYNSGLELAAPQKQATVEKEPFSDGYSGPIIGLLMIVVGIWAVPKMLDVVLPHKRVDG